MNLGFRRGGRGGRFFHRGDEAVAPPRDGFHKTRTFGRVAEDFAQLHHSIIQAVIEIDECISLPQAISQFIPGDDLTGSFQENGQNLERLFREFQAETVLAKFAGLKVHLENTEAHDL